MKIFKKGSIFGGVFLIAGSCIGAGMLALPIITGIGGFFSSIIMTIIAWAFMTVTGLLLLEVNSSFTGRVNIVSMSEKSFGFLGKTISWIFYLFLFYSLILAYIVGGGNIITSSLNQIFSSDLNYYTVAIIFTLLLASIVFIGTTVVDFVNRIFMFGLIITYFFIIFIGIKNIHIFNLEHINLEYSIVALPILVTSFGFHNMIPSIVSYMDYDYAKVKKSILIGSLVVLFIYLFWQFTILGIISYENLFSAYSKGIEVSQILKDYLDSSSSGFIQGFALFAIITSLLAQGLGLMHFIADGFKAKLNKKNKIVFVFATFLPPLLFAIYSPNIFFKALGFAGGICAIILFCLLPAFMAWQGRYKKQLVSSYRMKGGKLSLILIILFSLFIFIREIFRLFDY